jgi:hypothetical protein
MRSLVSLLVFTVVLMRAGNSKFLLFFSLRKYPNYLCSIGYRRIPKRVGSSLRGRKNPRCSKVLSLLYYFMLFYFISFVNRA